MQGATANRLNENVKRIMALWAERAKSEVDSATNVTPLTLANSLPLFLKHLGEGLAINRKVDFRSLALHDAEAVRIGKLHGADRAVKSSYVLTEVIFEYHILRKVIFEVLEEQTRLSIAEHDFILDTMEQAVNDAAVRFTEIHADIQEKFVSTLTHDLRNPLSAAKISAELVMRRPGDAEATAKLGGRIVSCLNRVDSMIQDLLDASKVRAGQALTFEFAECRLDSLLREIVEEMALAHGNRFQLVSKDSVIGYFGCDGLRRSVENLLGNAVKYSTPNTPITVTLNKLNKAVQIVVHNLGNPIDKSDQSKIFESYRRGEAGEKSAKPGWGLGLTLVKGVVEAHSGLVRVESSAENGTSFIVELPFSQHPQPELKSTDHAPQAFSNS